MSKIHAEHVKFSYGNEVVLKDITLAVEEGDFVCFLGASGCGKSTFLRMLAGLIEPEQGTIKVDGVPVSGASLQRGIVFQDYSLFPWFTAGKNLVLSLRQKYADLHKEEIKQKAMQHLREVGLDESVYDKYPAELSGGMRQRCAICRAFALDPPILLMDEPFGALDAITRTRLQDLLLALWERDKDKRKTIIFVTHDVDEALLLANKIIVFSANTGEVIYKYELPKQNKIQRSEFFGDSNIIDARNKLLEMLNHDMEKM